MAKICLKAKYEQKSIANFIYTKTYGSTMQPALGGASQSLMTGNGQLKKIY